ncbi:PIG-L family deacetylase [Sphingomonas sp. CA1-15]|uniref:PIG-L family deacetylase n=1 Tax=Sphingomonas immobilis TaxID=3063997 RepID=A0ABT8ZZ64_9SPHN|nr:PIG-L family deacetylase [Sphingomonas sp. CA1-15]
MSLVGIRSALIVAPHPDDETIGAHGLIRALKRQGARIHLVVATDGAGSHPGSSRWPRRRLVAERKRETLSAMRTVGVKAEDVRFLGFPDGRLSELSVKLRRTLRREIATIRKCNLIVIPARDDDHPDHRAVAAAIPSSGTRTLHYLVWPHRKIRSGRASHGLRLGLGTALKRGAIRRYRTQMGGITDDPNGFAISRKELTAFARPVEHFREAQR